MLRRRQSPAAAPNWIVTYSDTMGLLLCLFVILFAATDIKPERWAEMSGSVRAAFDKQSERSASLTEPQSIVQRLSAGDGVLEAKGADGCKMTRLPDGLRVTLSAPEAFSEGEPTLNESVLPTIDRLAVQWVGRETPICIRGHAFAEGDDAALRTHELAFQRAQQVGRRLLLAGVSPRRIRIESLGDSAPLVAAPITDAQRDQNRRVDIDITYLSSR